MSERKRAGGPDAQAAGLSDNQSQGVSIDTISGNNHSVHPHKVWMEIAAREKIIIVYPQGLNGSDGKSGWNDCRGDNTEVPTVNDVKFINALFTASHYPADPKRSYVVGTSNGGMMALRMALESPSTVTAVGAIIASMPANSECTTPSEPTSVLFINGTSDSSVPYAGGTVGGNASKGTVKSVAASIQFWTALNGTSATPTSTTNMPDINTGDASVVSLSVYNGGTNNTAVYEYTVTGGGHLEPSVKEQFSNTLQLLLGKQNRDIESAEIIWDFLKVRSK